MDNMYIHIYGLHKLTAVSSPRWFRLLSCTR